MKTSDVLASRPRLLRSTIARGISTRGLAASEKPIDPTGGDFGAGIIRGMAVLTRGEALGHGLWCDRTMLSQVCDAINSSSKGVKARFTHPDLSGDGLGKALGRVKNAGLDGDVVRGDLHFTQSAHQTPEGDLARYVMSLAAEDPAAFGNSIAFDEDYVAEDKHRAHHSQADSDGYPEFRSPDPDNERNLPHARVKDLRAIDAVDDPAANPAGLFHRGQELAADAEKLIAFSLGLSNERPALVALDADPDRIAGFIQRFLSRNNLTITQKEAAVPGKTIAELDAELRQHFSGARPPARKFEADKEDKKENEAEGAQEEGDADKDEGHDKARDEKRGDNYAGRTAGRTLASDEGQGDDEENDQNELEEGCDEEKDKTDKNLATAAKSKNLAKGGEAPGGDSSGDEGKRQNDYQDEEEAVSDGSKKPAKKGAAVEPDDGADAKGPMGDASHNVGYSAAVAECKRFTAAFGAQGGVWFAESKTFAQASALHTQQLKTDNERLTKENAELTKKLAAKRGLSEPLSGGTSVPIAPAAPKSQGAALSRFTQGLADQLQGRGHLN